VANEGFSGRKVEALLVDRTDPSHLYAGVVNDKSYGGVFASTNGGITWKQMGQGLEGRDVFALAQERTKHLGRHQQGHLCHDCRSR